MHIEDFVGVQTLATTHANGKVFWIGKVQDVQNMAMKDKRFLAF